jgi:ribonuclease HI
MSVFIKATMQESSSVIMAESAALALAANLLNQLQCRNTIILSDNQQLVHFLNGANLSNPPDWRIKSFTQIAANLLSATTSQVRRIKRNQNQMADSLAKQALQALTTNQIIHSSSCTNRIHRNDCPVLRAINDITINSVMVLSGSCC